MQFQKTTSEMAGKIIKYTLIFVIVVINRFSENEIIAFPERLYWRVFHRVLFSGIVCFKVVFDFSQKLILYLPIISIPFTNFISSG